MRFLTFVLLFFCLLGKPVFAETCCKKTECKICVYEVEVIRLCNLEREKRGLEPLKRLGSLVTACRQHSAVQRARRSMHHGSLKGCRAENVANTGQESPPKRVVRMWMNSPGHAANILSRRWKCIGYGRSSCGRYHTQQFR